MILDDENFDLVEKPHPTHKWFLWSAVTLFIIAFLININFGNSAIDIQMHDTYLVIPISYFPIFCGILMLLFSVAYFIINYSLKKSLHKNLSILHFIMTWIPMLALLSLPFKQVIPTYSSTPIFTPYDPFNNTVLIYFTIFILGIIIFLFNFFRSFFLSLYPKQN